MELKDNKKNLSFVSGLICLPSKYGISRTGLKFRIFHSVC